jgi:hypothetical protein
MVRRRVKCMETLGYEVSMLSEPLEENSDIRVVAFD